MARACIRSLMGFALIAVFGVATAQDYENAKASVVKIVSTSEDQRRTGTGFVVKVDGDDLYIATASHVVEGDKNPQVYFFARRNTAVKAQVLKLEGGDPRGLALLLIHGEGSFPKELQALALSQDDPLAGGQEVAAIGFGQGQGEWAVIRASVTSLDGRDIKLEGRIEEGNSGGPLLRNGQVVGLITGVKQGFGIATPAILVGAVLKGWGVELSAATSVREQAVVPPTPNSIARYALQPQQIKAGRKTREETQFDLRNAVLVVNVLGQQIRGTAEFNQKQVIDHEVLAVNAGRISKEGLKFATMTGGVTRDIAGDKATENKTNTLQGKSVVASKNGLTWNFDAGQQALSDAELRELQSHIASDDDGLPKGPVALGQSWEVTGQPLRNLLQLGDFSVSDGKAAMRLEQVVACGKAQCAEISLQLAVSGLMLNDDGSQTLVGVESTGRFLRILSSDINHETHLAGQVVMTGATTEQGVPMELVISGPFTYSARMTLQ